MRILGIDYGTKRIGLAISDDEGSMAFPLHVLAVKSEQQSLSAIKGACEERAAELIVVGIPVNMNGTRGPMAVAAESFAVKIERDLGIPVERWDERLTTSMTERALIDADVSRARRKEVVDKLAAQAILQSYLDFRRTASCHEDT